ncbi:uncharacterized protein LOC118471434 [Amphiprion ocellaris]|uniref:G-protein coupled receptors family 1 profile domain-containing protein n=1 Tax=Amphiprion ocellaris TaxID=80972 RepID=A0A3Q1AJV2_AMPOC|nr:uncharacterized protein LOC118471434 [Amphiprion ocellaris]
MSNHTTDVSPTQGSTVPSFSNSSTIISSTIVGNSTSVNSSSSPLDEIAANDIMSTAIYVYSFFAALGFLAGCFLLFSFVQTYRAHQRLAWLDCLLWVFCGLQLLLLLLSLHTVTRPKYLSITALSCAALSFTINTVSLCGLLVLVLMAYVLTLDPPSHALLRRPGVCVTLVVLTSVLISLVLAGVRGPRDGLHEVTDCSMDPTSAGVSYAAARLFMVFLIPYILQLGLLISGCVRQWKSKGRFLSGSEEGPVFLTVTVFMFFCLLFYSVSLLRGAQLESEKTLSYHERAFLTIAEFVLFSGSSISLLLVLFMHRPCRESLHGVMRQLRDCCYSPGRTQPNRNIIAPHIEITDTLQDIES